MGNPTFDDGDINAASPNDLRAKGWSVALHHDYTLAGVKFTFWLFTKGNFAAKGEATSDSEALNQVRAAVKLLEGKL